MKIREVYFIGFLGFKTLVLQRPKVAFTVREPLGKTEGNPRLHLKKATQKVAFLLSAGRIESQSTNSLLHQNIHFNFSVGCTDSFSSIGKLEIMVSSEQQ